jgi:CYTH domain-containing protein
VPRCAARRGDPKRKDHRPLCRRLATAAARGAASRRWAGEATAQPKADVDSRTRLITSIYLPEEEFTVLAASLPGPRIEKLRHTLRSPPGVVLSVDQFQGELTGLVMVEAEFGAFDLMAAFPMPDFAFREVTDDPRYSGGHLVKHGLPEDRQNSFHRI